MFTHPVGYSRPLSTVNDPSVTKKIEFMESLIQKNCSEYCNQEVAPFIQYMVHLHREVQFFESCSKNQFFESYIQKFNPLRHNKKRFNSLIHIHIQKRVQFFESH